MKLVCPRCSTPLYNRHEQQITGHICGGCGGVWIGKGTAHALSQTRQLAMPLCALAQDAACRAPFGGSLSNIAAACPACHGTMRRLQYQPPGLIVDVCPNHGVWFDRGELQQFVTHLWPESTENGRTPYRQPPADKLPSTARPVEIPPQSVVPRQPEVEALIPGTPGVDEALVEGGGEAMAHGISELLGLILGQ